jgi:hypothetical protein
MACWHPIYATGAEFIRHTPDVEQATQKKPHQPQNEHNVPVVKHEQFTAEEAVWKLFQVLVHAPL